MTTQKGAPSLAGRPPPLDHVLGNARLRDLKRARQTRKQRSLVLHPAISLVSINPQGPHGHPSRDAGSLASGRLSQLLALEVTIIGRAATDRDGPSRTDPADEHRKHSLGRAAHPR